MSILCKICSKEFEKQITNSHLRTHNLTTAEYKNVYGEDSLTCAIYKSLLAEKRSGSNNPNFNRKWDPTMKKNMSELKKGSVPWNKGKTYEATDSMLEGIRKREEKYELGKISRTSQRPSEHTKRKISESVALYASTHSDEIADRAKKAIETKIKNGYDFGKNMRGKKHSDETKLQLAKIRNITNIKKNQKSKENIIENAAKANCKVISFNQQYIKLLCLVCQHTFTFTKQYFTDSKLNIECCTICFPRIPQYRSQGEIDLFNFILELEPTAQSNVRQILGKSEIDIYLPLQRIAIEYNGLYWHSEEVLTYNGKSKISDYLKRQKIRKLGLRYIAVFEDEWVNKPEIVKSRIRNILKKTSNIIYARKCSILPVDSKAASQFCEINHIQGKGRSNTRYGLYYKNELVSLMTFSKNNLSRKIVDWEINRFCSKTNTNVVGAASKLFKHFVKEHSPTQVISYSDNRWSDGNLYKTLNFDLVKETKPNYWYTVPNTIARIHRFNLRKTSKDNTNISEMQLRTKEGFKRIWDSGSTKWLWTNENGA